jgi:hypothetical protein
MITGDNPRCHSPHLARVASPPATLVPQSHTELLLGQATTCRGTPPPTCSHRCFRLIATPPGCRHLLPTRPLQTRHTWLLVWSALLLCQQALLHHLM